MSQKFIPEDYENHGQEELLREILKRLDKILVKAGDRPRQKQFNTTKRCRKCKEQTVNCVDQSIYDHNMVCSYSCDNCREFWKE